MNDAIVYLEDVTVSYEGFKALDRLNFFMDRRELRVVIGPNGAGKTTLLDVISGRVKAVHGRVIFGRSTDLTVMTENQIAALGVGRKFQTPSIFANLSVWENLELSCFRPSKGVFATLRSRLDGPQRDRIEETLAVCDGIQEIGITVNAGNAPHWMAIKNQELFAERVAPRFRGRVAVAAQA